MDEVNPPVALTDPPAFLIDNPREVNKMDEVGFIIIPQLVPAGACEALKAAIITRATTVLNLMGEELGADCTGLLRITNRTDKNPHPNWLDSGTELSWGAFGRRGWVKAVGSGRLFQGAFETEPAALAVQEHTRRAVAFLHKVDPQRLSRQPEKVSLKPLGCPELPPHLDRDRKGTYQAIR